ncbi:VIT1/CCC1 transporter family protein [Candidatus Micrarchaeota archaeon]|nr:VIT1/CCC1 transporter family protein [Candidatus Micrarchaeota archaeon]MBU1929879.1 VIT1/CCC1 transporter family protein [Candidatus Micrarchaeota archaeon]
MYFLTLLKQNAVIRRYIIMNSFDGALTILGILIATFLAQILNPTVIIVSSLGVIVSTGVSGIWGGYMAERAEKKKARRELEMHLMRRLSKTKIEREMKKVAWFMGLANGLSSTIVSLIAIIPFFLAVLGFIQVIEAFVYSFIIIFITIFLLGVFIGKIARESILFHGSAMVVVGVIVGIILYAFEIATII